MKPFTQAVEGEQFLTYAEDLDMARLAFMDEGLPGDGRIREQRLRKAREFVYTHPDRGNTPATIVGDVPAELTCATCKGTHRLINRDGSGLQALEPDESREVTAKPSPSAHGRSRYWVSIGEVCPCPSCVEDGNGDPWSATTDGYEVAS